MPPKAMADMLLAKPSPNVSVDDKGEWMLFTDVSLYPSVEELARPEFRIAVMRINPSNYAPSRQNFISNIWLKNISTGKEYKIGGLIFSIAGSNLTNKFGIELDLQTVGQLAEKISRDNYLKSRRNSSTVNKAEIAKKVKELFIADLDLEETVLTRQATFV
jgi:hypothetical protein